MLVTTDAFALKARKFRDTSKIISFYTADDGMITCIAKGARLPKNKFGSALEPLNVTQITYYKKRNTDLYLLSKAETVTSLKNILNSYDKLNIGLSILESVTLTQINNDPNIDIFNLLKDTLIRLDESGKNFYNFFYKFQLELAKIIGYSISFSYFDFNKIEKNNNYKFDFESGEFINSNNKINSFSLTGLTTEYMKKINDTNLNFLSDIDLEIKYVNTLNTFFAKYFSYHLDKGINFKTLANYIVS